MIKQLGLKDHICCVSYVGHGSFDNAADSEAPPFQMSSPSGRWLFSLHLQAPSTQCLSSPVPKTIIIAVWFLEAEISNVRYCSKLAFCSPQTHLKEPHSSV